MKIAMDRRTLLIAWGAAWGLPAARAADGLEMLQVFLREARSGRAEFTQSITTPPRQGETQGRVRQSSGVFEFSRPNRFRFSYRKPFEQTLVSDGQTLWIHDIDLNQVTVRKLAQVMTGTPALLIASSTELKALERDFVLTALPGRDEQAWVRATPRVTEGQVQRIEAGFREAGQGAALATLVVTDSFGQVSTLRFATMEINPRIAPGVFEFKPPPGADVLRP